MAQSFGLNAQNRYEIQVSGELDDGWLGWLVGVEIHSGTAIDEGPVTTLSNVVTDQAGLVGLIRRLHGLGILLLSVRKV